MAGWMGDDGTRQQETRPRTDGRVRVEARANRLIMGIAYTISREDKMTV